MNTLLIWIMVAAGPSPQAYTVPAYYPYAAQVQYASQVDCLRARNKLAHYDDRLKRQWTCESIRVAAADEEAVDPAAVERANRNYQHEQETLNRILTVPQH